MDGRDETRRAAVTEHQHSCCGRWAEVLDCLFLDAARHLYRHYNWSEEKEEDAPPVTGPRRGGDGAEPRTRGSLQRPAHT